MSGIVKIEPRDVERTVKAMLHREMRDDIRVTVAYLVRFEVDDNTFVNTVIEPWQPMPRSAYDKLVKEVIKNLDGQEKAQEPKTNVETDNPFQPQIPPAVDSAVLDAADTAAAIELVAETGIYTAEEIQNVSV